LDIDSLDFVGTGTITSAGSDLTLNSGNNTITFDSTDTTLTATGLATIDAAATLGIDSTLLNLGNGSAATLGTTSNSNLSIDPDGTGELTLVSDFESGVNVGSISNTPAPLSIEGGIGSNATLIVNQLNSGDILSASASGTTLFRVTNTGEVVIGDDGSSFFTTLDPTTLTADRTLTLPDETGTVCVQGSVSCGFALGDNYWQVNTAFLSPINSTLDFGIGGTSTTSAQFAITGVNNDAPVATLAGSTNNGIEIDANASTIQSLLNNTLTIGGDTTGNIVLSPLNGGSGSNLSTNAETFTLTGTTTINGTSLTSINGGATAINFDEFDVDASTGSITIDDGGNAGNISIEGTTLDIDSLDFVGTGTITSAGSDLTLNSGNNTITFDSTDTTLTATGLATI
ncbi:hypothetical protein MJD09_14615, partial [bacterium]|nr:hypothetical protein [bacterium]